MKVSYLLLLAFVIHVGCNKKMNDSNKDLLWMDSFEDVYLQKIPDEFRSLVPTLDSIYRDDQKFRSISDPDLYSRNFKKQKLLDSINIAKVVVIIETYGWLGKKQVGTIGASAIDLVMIHSDIATKVKYYPVLVDGVRKGMIDFESLAVYEDKMNALLKRKQHYGTQIIKYKGHATPYPIYLPEEVEKKRQLFKLLPLKTYVSMFKNSNWSMSEYMQELPEIIRLNKVNDSIPVHVGFGP